MTALQQSLGVLYQSIEALDSVAQAQKQKLMTAQQTDLFKADNDTESGFSFDPVLVVQKLDDTIEKMEQLLKEA